jgi:twitching motility protein PilT
LEVNKEIDFAYSFKEGSEARFRVNAYYSRGELSAAFRLIPSKVKTIEELMLPQIYHQFAQLKQGFVLVTGPTGHGKSTTLAAILEDINRTRFCHIVTIEDPIEYIFEGKKALVDQRER